MIDIVQERFVTTIFRKGNISIDMAVDTRDGAVRFEGYIAGEYVPFSRDSTVSATVRVINNQLRFLYGE